VSKQRFSVRRLWPFDTAITISVIALVISFAQLLVTTPFVVDLYLKPRLVVEQVPHSGSPNVVTFYVRNDGRATAKSIEIGVVAGEQDRVSTMPDLGGTVNNDESKVIRNFRVTVPYLNRSEGFWVHVYRDASTPQNLVGQLIDRPEIWLDTGPIPAVTYLRSDGGAGDIRAPKLGPPRTLNPNKKSAP
jgi:hypothetical protein